jgi:hypothetical protein
MGWSTMKDEAAAKPVEADAKDTGIDNIWLMPLDPFDARYRVNTTRKTTRHLDSRIQDMGR